MIDYFLIFLRFNFNEWSTAELIFFWLTAELDFNVHPYVFCMNKKESYKYNHFQCCKIITHQLTIPISRFYDHAGSTMKVAPHNVTFLCGLSVHYMALGMTDKKLKATPFLSLITCSIKTSLSPLGRQLLKKADNFLTSNVCLAILIPATSKSFETALRSLYYSFCSCVISLPERLRQAIVGALVPSPPKIKQQAHCYYE